MVNLNLPKDLSKQQVQHTKSIAILFMLLLHLFANDKFDLYNSFIYINNVPLEYYIGLYGDSCVAIFCFCSGFGLFKKFSTQGKYSIKSSFFRLLINYWVVIFVFVLIIGPILGLNGKFPGSFYDFCLNFFAIKTSYNGAWWFVTIYFMLIFTSKFIFSRLLCFRYYYSIPILIVIYTISYIYRIKISPTLDSNLLSGIFYVLSLYGMSLFPFFIGALSAKFNFFGHLKIRFGERKVILLLLLMASFVFHCYVQTLFVAVFNAFLFCFVFNVWSKPKFVNDILDFLSIHSTNIWLVHMFFYIFYFPDVVYYTKNSAIIFLSLLALSVFSSLIINYLLTRLRFIYGKLFVFIHVV